MDMFLIRSISYANCFRGVFDQSGAPRRIRANEKSVLKAVAEGMVCDIDIVRFVSKSSMDEVRKTYVDDDYISSEKHVISDLIGLVGNQKRIRESDGTYKNVRLDENTISDIAVRCSLSYRQAGAIIRRLVGFGALKIKGCEIVVVADKLDKRGEMERKKFI